MNTTTRIRLGSSGTLLVALLISAFLPITAEAADCSPQNISSLEEQCFTILRDVAGTRDEGDRAAKAAESKAVAGLEPAAKCSQGIYELIVNCWPQKPDLVSCAEAIASLPDTVNDCKRAYALFNEALRLYRQALSYYGTAEIAFTDQGGDEILNSLSACGRKACDTTKGALHAEISNSKARVQRNIDEILRFLAAMQDQQKRAEECSKDRGKCPTPSEVELPSIERAPDGGTRPEPRRVRIVVVCSGFPQRKAAGG